MTRPFPYPYAVKRSSRARRVRLVVSLEGLTVVVPQKFCVTRDLPPILEGRKAWIADALKRVAQRVRQRDETRGIPEEIELRALGETWRVAFAPLTRDRLTARGGTLTLTSDFSEEEALAALRHWLHVKGREHLPALLEDAARAHRFSYAKVAVKEQKSRWGSCSSKGNLNLNSRLLFLPPRLVEHVLLHELCHLQEMNHSRSFHELLERLDPEAPARAAELRQAWSFVPGWAL